MTTLPATPILPPELFAPSPPALSDAIPIARAAIETVASDYLAIPDAALERQWLWRGHDHGDGVRYGIYRAAETIERAHAALEAALVGTPARPAAAVRIAPATIARWSLQGRLVALDDARLDQVPKAGEWTARQTIGHIIEGQRSYGWFSRWWLSQPLGADRPGRVTPGAEAAAQQELPDEAAEGVGSVEDLRARLDAVLDEWAGRFALLGPETLALPATWAGVPVDIDFRLGRWASHIREHTIQLDKTLDWLGHRPSEVERIVRQLYEAWGRLEASIFPVAPAGTDDAGAAILAELIETVVAEARTVRIAAGA